MLRAIHSGRFFYYQSSIFAKKLTIGLLLSELQYLIKSIEGRYGKMFFTTSRLRRRRWMSEEAIKCFRSDGGVYLVRKDIRIAMIYGFIF